MKVEPVSRQDYAPEAPAARADRVRRLRRLLMVVVPGVALLAGGAIYALTGRTVGTDNAYVKADIANLSPDISGSVIEVLVNENQPVAKGQDLVRIDDTNYRFALAMALAEIRSATATVETDRAQYRQKQESLRMAQTDLAFADRELKRQAALGAGKFVSQSKVDEVRHAYDSAQERIGLLKQEQAEILAKLQGNPDVPLEQHPSYQTAKAHEAAARHYLDSATVRAPFDGVATRVPKVGDYARSGAPLLSVVSKAIWVDANFKETQLTHMRPGQPASIQVDAYPGRAFKAHVESIAQASGGEFALLPAQNSTGNWVKVVQRIPVRIAIDDAPAAGGPVLRAGMSVTAEVDTGARRLTRWFESGPPASR
jgi:membrane fusion protein (multidrug efflux system)